MRDLRMGVSEVMNNFIDLDFIGDISFFYWLYVFFFLFLVR